MRITGRELRQIIRETLMEADPRRRGAFSGATLFAPGAVEEDEPTDPGIDLGAELEEEEKLTSSRAREIAIGARDEYMRTGALGREVYDSVAALISQGALAGRNRELDNMLKLLMREVVAQIGMSLNQAVSNPRWAAWFERLPRAAQSYRMAPAFGETVPLGIQGGTIDDVPERVIAAFDGLLSVGGDDYGLIITDGGRLSKSARGAPGPMRLMTFKMEAAPPSAGYSYSF